MTSPKRKPAGTLGVPYDEAVAAGICGAQRKDDPEPCAGARDEEGRSVCGNHCGAKNSSGYPCSQRCMANGRCRSHGGLSPSGPDHGRWVDGTSGRQRRIFSGDAWDHYERALQNPNYVDLRQNLAILDTMKTEALIDAQTGGGVALLAELGRAWDALREVGRLIAGGVSMAQGHEKALDIIERQRRTTETERKTMMDRERTITQVQGMSFASAYNALLREVVAGEPYEGEVLGRFNAGAARLVREYVAGGA